MEKKREFPLLKSMTMPVSDLQKSNEDNLLPNICTNVPQGWKQTLPSDFRPLQWVYPLALDGKPYGYFESVLHDFNTRSKKIFLWHVGDKYIQVIPRPAHLLPAESLPCENVHTKERMSCQRKRIFNPRKSVDAFATATWIYYRRCKVLKYSYTSAQKTTSRLDADRGPTRITLDHRNSCGNSDTSHYSVPSTAEPEESPYSTSPASSVDKLEQWPNRNDLPDLADIHVAMLPHRNIMLQKELIGQGTFGAVRPAHLSGVGQVVVKSFNELSTSADILREARIMAALAETSFVPKLYGVTYGRDFRVSIIQEYCAKGVTLFDVLTKYKLPEQIWIHIIKQLVLGVKLIHERGILINDLKNDNILVDIESWNFELKLIDFGLSSYGEGRVFNVCRELRPRLRHMAPEVLDGEPTIPASDIYSIGVIVEEISIHGQVSGLCDLVDACLGPAEDRPTCDSLLKHLENLF